MERVRTASGRPRRAAMIGMGLALCGLALAWQSGQRAGSAHPRSPDAATPDRAPALARAEARAPRATKRGPSPEDTLELLDEGFRAVETEHFVILTDAPPAAARAHGRIMESTRREFLEFVRELGLRARTPSDRLACVLFDRRRDYAEFARTRDKVDPSWIAGYYAIGANRVVLYNDGSLPGPPGGGGGLAGAGPRTPIQPNDRPRAAPDARSLAHRGAAGGTGHLHAADRTAHETVHLLAYNTGIQSPALRYPLWISEGLALAFERGRSPGPGSRSGPRGAHPQCADRWARQHRRAVLDVLDATGSLLDWRRVISAERVPRGEAAIQAFYTQCGVLFRHLAAEKPGMLSAYLLDLGRRPADVGHAAWFERSFGPLDRIARDLDAP